MRERQEVQKVLWRDMNGEVGYCVVMGHGSEHFGLGVYLGTEGLEGVLKMQTGYLPSNTIDMLVLHGASPPGQGEGIGGSGGP